MPASQNPTADAVRETVREKYAASAQAVLSPSGGCGSSCCSSSGDDLITGGLYSDDDAELVPADALTASLGCGNPTALAELAQGETVLDLGSGGGIDVLLSARRVGPTGFAYGLDMTDEMLELAERNKRESGIENVEFLKGQMEAIPLADAQVDIVISNCVINLAVDKGRVLREAFRVLKPGGRFAVSDVVTQGELPDDLRRDMVAWVGCVAGALDEGVYRQLLTDAGFYDVGFQVTRAYDPKELAQSVAGECCGPANDSTASWNDSAYARFAASGGQVVSAFVRAVKPGA